MYAYEIKNIKKETVYKNREMRQHLSLIHI